MELLDRYLLQIEKFLPLKDREDIIQELKSLLLEDLDNRMMEGGNQDDNLYQVIKEYGEPREVALRYRSDSPIFSREMEPFLYMVLKIVMITTPAAILLAKSIDFLNSGDPFNFINLLINMLYSIPDMFSAAVTAAGFVFILFYLIEKYAKPNIKLDVPEFEPKHLPQVPRKVYKVSLFESIFTIVASIVIIYLLNYQPGLIAIYYDGDSIPLLNNGFTKLLPVINTSILFAAGIAIAHAIKRRKTFITTTLEFMQTVYSGVVLALLASSDIFNTVVIEGYELEIIPRLFVIGASIGATLTILGAIVTYAKVIIARSGSEEFIKNTINKLDK